MGIIEDWIARLILRNGIPEKPKEPKKTLAPAGKKLLSDEPALYEFIDRCFENELPADTLITSKFRPSNKTRWSRHVACDSRTATLRGHRSHHRGDSTARSLASDRQGPNH